MPARYPERIVCLTEETTETLYLLGEERRIVGISGYTVRPPRTRREKPRVSAFLSAKQDAILALKPDLVLGFSDLQADIARDLAKAGLNVVLFNQRSIDEILSMVLLLASMVGAAERGERLVRDLEKNLAEIRVSAAHLQRHPLGERARDTRGRRRCIRRAFALTSRERAHRAARRRSRAGTGRDDCVLVRKEVQA